MSVNFAPGEKIKVVMAQNNIFPWQHGPTFDATFQAGPSGPGDVFIVLVGEEAQRVYLNGNSPEFVAMYQPASVELK